MPAASHPPLLALTAADMMTPNVVRVPHDMSVRTAAQLLVRHQIGGAPVVDDEGKCIGMFSALDFLRHSSHERETPRSPLPLSCSYVERHTLRDGSDRMLCCLSLGSCPSQVEETRPDGEMLTVCRQPHSVMSDWQTVIMETLPEQVVRHFMTPDPVSVERSAPIARIARMMMDAHIHRVLVLDQGEPVGIVSSTDLLAALARTEENAWPSL